MKVIKFAPGLIPVLKHQEHDQSSHGSWAGGSVSFKQDKNSLTMQDESGKTLASVDFVNLGNNRLDINSIDSFDEGKGYATKVLEKLYSSFPEHSIFWGKTILPASTHLAQKFSDKYGRTEFMPWGKGAIDGYEWGQLYGDTTVKKHGTHDQKTHGNWAHGSSFGDFTLDEGADSRKLATYSHPNGTRVIFQNLSKVESSSPMVRETLETIDGLSKKYPVPNLTFVVQSGSGGGIITRGFDGICYSPARNQEGDRMKAYLEQQKMPLATDPNAPYIAIRQRVIAPDSVPKVTYVGAGGYIRPQKTQEQKTAYLKEIITHEWGHALDKRSQADSNIQFRNRDQASTSRYGNKNGREFFAETFAAFELGGLVKDRPDNIPNYKKASEYLAMDSLREKVSKESFEGFVTYENFETGEPLLIEGGTPLDFDESVQKHQEHDQSSHGNWATGQKGGSGLSHREMFNLKRNRLDPLAKKVYEAEEKNRNQIQDKNIEAPSAPNRADFDEYDDYNNAHKKYSRDFLNWSRKVTTSVISPMGEKHLDGTPRGVTGYVRDVLRQDWFVEQFGRGGSAGNPEVKVSSSGEAGAYQIGFKADRPISILRINSGYTRAEPTIVHEISHYATTISATSPHDGHGVEFARNHIFVASKVMGQSFADGLEKAYREAGIPLGD